MPLAETLMWPFFDDGHRRFAGEVSRWARTSLPALPHDDVNAACRARVRALGEAGFLKAVVPATFGGLH
ncbi:MAG: acyl-CoA dehydrogenase, partial [Alphaproteobacteria bacterium]|nr:acyl-CoA dehydrogenase [Alphaproteobacteria bacterium]